MHELDRTHISSLRNCGIRLGFTKKISFIIFIFFFLPYICVFLTMQTQPLGSDTCTHGTSETTPTIKEILLPLHFSHVQVQGKTGLACCLAHTAFQKQGWNWTPGCLTSFGDSFLHTMLLLCRERIKPKHSVSFMHFLQVKGGKNVTTPFSLCGSLGLCLYTSQLASSFSS